MNVNYNLSKGFDVYLNGVKLQENYDYTLSPSSSIITFPSPMASSDTIEVLYQRSNEDDIFNDYYSKWKLIPSCEVITTELELNKNFQIVSYSIKYVSELYHNKFKEFI